MQLVARLETVEDIDRAAEEIERQAQERRTDQNYASAILMLLEDEKEDLILSRMIKDKIH